MISSSDILETYYGAPKASSKVPIAKNFHLKLKISSPQGIIHQICPYLNDVAVLNFGIEKLWPRKIFIQIYT